MSFVLRIEAVAQCDHTWKRVGDYAEWGCTYTEKIKDEADHWNHDAFTKYATDEFIKRGWQFFGGTKCPEHAHLKNGEIPKND